MATLIIIAKIASIVLALRFFQAVTSVKTEPNLFGFQLNPSNKSLKIFIAAILVLVALSLIPWRNISLSPSVSKEKKAINKQDIIGTWEIDNEIYTITYDQDRDVHFDFGESYDKGSWNITGDVLRISMNGKTRKYNIINLTENEYEILNIETQEIFKGLKIDE